MSCNGTAKLNCRKNKLVGLTEVSDEYLFVNASLESDFKLQVVSLMKSKIIAESWFNWIEEFPPPSLIETASKT